MVVGVGPRASRQSRNGLMEEGRLHFVEICVLDVDSCEFWTAIAVLLVIQFPVYSIRGTFKNSYSSRRG